MFPEITRDEVFRIETPRLWLRWPAFGDADALALLMASMCRQAGSSMAHANTQAVGSLIARWREDMEAGQAIHLVLVPKAGARVPVGVVHVSAARRVRIWPESGLGETGAEAQRGMASMLNLLRLHDEAEPAVPPERDDGAILSGLLSASDRAAASTSLAHCLSLF